MTSQLQRLLVQQLTSLIEFTTASYLRKQLGVVSRLSLLSEATCHGELRSVCKHDKLLTYSCQETKRGDARTMRLSVLSTVISFSAVRKCVARFDKSKFVSGFANAAN